MSKKIKSMDGNSAAGYVGYMMSEVATIYPITPSSPMAEIGDEMAANGQKNIFGQTVKFAEMQSEAGAAGSVHGSLAAGAMTTTYTASQGLLLMIPNMYKIAGEMLPSVFHVSARTIAAHALNIFGDHSDVMACRQTGFIMLASNNVQEVMDLAYISHVATYKAKLPILHFFDGFRTSHEINKIEVLDSEFMLSMLPKMEIAEFKKHSHNPLHPHQTGTAQNADIFFQAREAINKYYDEAFHVVANVMKEFGEKTGRLYKPFKYVGAADATDVTIAMGSGCDTLEQASEYLNKHGKKTGVLKVHLYRPFNAKAFVEALPKTVKRVAVLDRTKEAGSLGEPLYLDVVAAIKEWGLKVKVLGGRYGLGGKDFLPADAVSVYENLKSKDSINHFTVGIDDDVTHTSLSKPKSFKGLGNNYYAMKFYGLGSDGTVSANKSSIKIVGDLTSKYVQGYFEYDSKKSGSLTTSHLRIGDTNFHSPYLVYDVDFIAVHNYAFVNQYDVLKGLKPGGNVLLNTSLTDEQLARDLPQEFKKHLKDAKAKLYAIPAFDVAKAAGLGNRINVIMQACFFKIANIIPYTDAEKEMKAFATKAYGKKGEKVLAANMRAIDSATTDLREIDVKKVVSTKTQSITQSRYMTEYFKNWVNKINSRHGDSMKVSEFEANGSVPNGTTQYEKRGIGLNVPVWNPDKCIQCGQCILVCPHAVLRSYLISDADKAKAPASLTSKAALGVPGSQFVIQCSPWDCTGCESCARTCIAKEKALEMKDMRSVLESQEKNWEFVQSITQTKHNFPKSTVKGIQFNKPYFEFSGACSGCGETPYVTLVSRLFGDSMMIANATGCSSIYGGSAPSNPYTIDKDGHGPSWANSLFEDNAEFGYGMQLAIDYQRSEAVGRLEKIAASHGGALADAINAFIAVKDTYESKSKVKEVVELLKNATPSEEITAAIHSADQLPKRSMWIFGGDGWAYDIGYGGLDHVIAQKENVNILVLDTEVYSNTGGQASKSTPAGSIAKFAANGKVTRKKDLGLIAMSYKDVYVAHVSMGANPQQLMKALIEAESYNGPSLIIAYAPCINHGINLSGAQAEMKKAVETGYWTLYRYDPRNKDAPLTIDSPEPTKDYREFLMGENRYVSLTKKSPEHAEALFTASAAEAKEARETLKRMVASQVKQ